MTGQVGTGQVGISQDITDQGGTCEVRTSQVGPGQARIRSSKNS